MLDNEVPSTESRSHPGAVSIGAASRLAGIPVPTIRSWEIRYGFPTPLRTPGGHRRYTAGTVELLRVLVAAVSVGRLTPREAVETVVGATTTERG